MTHAIVIGGSMAGLATAASLARVVDTVEVLERDPLPDEPRKRRGVPQARHAHGLLGAGCQELERLLPGFLDDLVAHGGVPVRSTDAWWHFAGAWRTRPDLDRVTVSSSRPFLEWRVRRLVAALPGVQVRQSTGCDGLVVEGGRVRGVLVDGRPRRADLVVDCSGRHTRIPEQLAGHGFAAPEVSRIHIDMAYGTRLLERRPDDFDGRFALELSTPDVGSRVGVLMPLEDDRWILTLAGFHGDAPPSDDEGYLAYARSLPGGLVHEVLRSRTPLTPVAMHRMESSQRRHFERLRVLPAGFVALGDAVCSFNPMYGQGMSSAALQAVALGDLVGRYGAGGAHLPHAFYRRVAPIVDNPWQIAAGADFLHPLTTGPKPRGTDLVNRYLLKVQLACHTSPEVAAAMLEVQNLLAPPTSLLSPRTVARVLRAAGRSPAVTGLPGPAPRTGVVLAA